MSLCFVPCMPQAYTMWQAQPSGSPNSTTSSCSLSSVESLPSCHASSGSAFTFSPTPSPIPSHPEQATSQFHQQSPLFCQQQTSPSFPTSPFGQAQSPPASNATATTPLSWKDYPTGPNASASASSPLPPLPAIQRSAPSRQTSSAVQYTPEKMHVYSGDLSPLEQCRLRTWPLRQWIYQHRVNPYPTKADKRMLAKQANLREDQVNMWFANTRRRIKKVGMKSWSGGLFEDFQSKATADTTTEGNLLLNFSQRSDGYPSDDDSFLSGASSGSDIILPGF